jgi:hypothetical protein
MMNFDPRLVDVPISTALVAAALDCLALTPDSQLNPLLLIAVTRTLASNTSEADALLIRIRAAAIMLDDPRWHMWASCFRASQLDMQCIFEVVLLDCVATLPFDAWLQYSPDEFFDTLFSGTTLFVSN